MIIHGLPPAPTMAHHCRSDAGRTSGTPQAPHARTPLYPPRHGWRHSALGVTSLDATRASPPAIAGLVRGQQAIESLHWLCDTLYREDNFTVRTRSGPRAMAL
jgi:hypothetical protein